MESPSWLLITVLFYILLDYSLPDTSSPQTTITSPCRNGHQGTPRPVAAFRDDRRQTPCRYCHYSRRNLPSDIAGLSTDPGLRAGIPQSTMGIRRYHLIRSDGMQLRETDLFCE